MNRARLRDLGIITGLLPPGPCNAITDVPGVRVGYTTLIYDEPKIVRTGVTAIWPRNEIWTDAVFAGTHSFNGNGEMTGLPWIAEQGLIGAPICITNTYSVDIVRDAVCALAVRDGAPQSFHLPVVTETYDGWLSDCASFPLTTEHAIAALDSAASGPVLEGNVGGGTGMICHEFKGGTGTASRIVEIAGESCTVGALVQANYGSRELLRVDGVPGGVRSAARWSLLREKSGRKQARLLSFSPRTPRYCQSSASAWPAVPRSAWLGSGASAPMAVATSSSPSPLATTFGTTRRSAPYGCCHLTA
jgi:D-aminopeptidase